MFGCVHFNLREEETRDKRERGVCFYRVGENGWGWCSCSGSQRGNRCGGCNLEWQATGMVTRWSARGGGSCALRFVIVIRLLSAASECVLVSDVILVIDQFDHRGEDCWSDLVQSFGHEATASAACFHLEGGPAPWDTDRAGISAEDGSDDRIIASLHRKESRRHFAQYLRRTCRNSIRVRPRNFFLIRPILTIGLTDNTNGDCVTLNHTLLAIYGAGSDANVLALSVIHTYSIRTEYCLFTTKCRDERRVWEKGWHSTWCS